MEQMSFFCVVAVCYFLCIIFAIILRIGDEWTDTMIFLHPVAPANKLTLKIIYPLDG